MMSKVHLKKWESGSSGVKIIFLHGFPLDHTIWQPVLPFLQGSAHCILPDLRGHGESPVSEGVSTMLEMADDVAGLMDDLGMERAVLVGHSMGGYISFAFAKAFPERLQGLALVATHPLADDEHKRLNRLQTADTIEQTGVETLAASMPASLTSDPKIRAQLQNIIRKISPAGAAAALRGMAEREESLSLLDKIQVPAVVIAGERDSIVPLSLAAEMASRLPKGKLVAIPNGGHMPMMEAPDQTAAALLELVERVRLTTTQL